MPKAASVASGKRKPAAAKKKPPPRGDRLVAFGEREQAGFVAAGAVSQAREGEPPPYTPYRFPPRVYAKVGPGGRVVIPASFREAMGIETGTEVMLTLHGQELRVSTPMAAMLRAQALVSQFAPQSGTVVDEFIAERPALWGEDDQDG